MTIIQTLSPAEAALYAQRGEAASGPAGGQRFFGDDLSSEVAEAYRVLRLPLSAEQVVAIDTSHPFGARVVQYRMYNATGAAQFVDEGAGSIPTIGVGAERPEAPYLPYGVKIAWSDADMEAIQAARSRGVRFPDLYRELTEAALRAMDEFANDAIWAGRGPIKGLLAAPYAKTPAGVKIARGTAATGDAIVNAILNAKQEIFRATKGVLRPNFIAYNTESWAYIETAVYDVNAGAATILETLRARTPGIEHFPAWELDAGIESKPAILIGRRDKMMAFVARSEPRYYAINEIDGGVSYSQVILAKISDLLLPQPSAYAALTRCDGT
jgi:hypothetical protein